MDAFGIVCRMRHESSRQNGNEPNWQPATAISTIRLSVQIPKAFIRLNSTYTNGPPSRSSSLCLSLSLFNLLYLSSFLFAFPAPPIRISCWKHRANILIHKHQMSAVPRQQHSNSNNIGGSGNISSGSNNSTNRTCQEDRINKSLLPNWFKKYAACAQRAKRNVNA